MLQVPDVMAKVRELRAQPLWPGYDAMTIPVAIYDGESTWLFDHPAPPPEFMVDGGYFRMEGLHPAVRANSSTELGGHTIATATAFGPRATLTEAATLIIHEMFHVYQHLRHPDWGANEAEQFTYPLEDAELLALRRLETEALRRALTEDSWQSWAAAALHLRAARFARLSEGAAKYERDLELFEGLATYVEHKAASDHDHSLPAAEYGAGELRLRSYQVGRAMALLLDRVRPAWCENVQAPLDDMLREALGQVAPFAFTAAEETEARQRSQSDVAALMANREADRRAYLEAPGHRLVIETYGNPLRSKAFDPLNVRRVAAGEVLHSRYLVLGNDAATIEVLDRAVLTEAAGAHPLFQGVRRAVLTGLADAPRWQQEGERLTLRAPGLTISVPAGTVAPNGEHVCI